MCQAFQAVQRNTGVYISRFCICCFADQFPLHLLNLFFSFIHYETTTKANSSFFTQKSLAVEPEKHEDGLDKDGGEAGEVSSMMSVVQSFNNHSLTRASDISRKKKQNFAGFSGVNS